MVVVDDDDDSEVDGDVGGGWTKGGEGGDFDSSVTTFVVRGVSLFSPSTSGVVVVVVMVF